MNLQEIQSINKYRNLFIQTYPDHAWNTLSLDEFLIQIHAAARDKGSVVLTDAGTLMFGDIEQILERFPDYKLQYQEFIGGLSLYDLNSEDKDWSGNLFDFYFKLIPRIESDIAVPFVSRKEGFRISRVDAHTALETVVANSLAYTNYERQNGLYIQKQKRSISLSYAISDDNLEESGYHNDLMSMFSLVNLTSNHDMQWVLDIWMEQGWDRPDIVVLKHPYNRMEIKLKVGQIVYIPGIADLRKGTAVL